MSLRCDASDGSRPFNFTPAQRKAIYAALSDGGGRVSHWCECALTETIVVHRRTLVEPDYSLKGARFWQYQEAVLAEASRILTADRAGAGPLTEMIECGTIAFDDLLTELTHVAAEAGDQARGHESNGFRRKAPMYRLVEEACSCWLHASGALRTSRDPSTGAPSGPVIRYLAVVIEAAVAPRKPPSAESLYRFVRRERRRYKQSGVELTPEFRLANVLSRGAAPPDCAVGKSSGCCRIF